MLCYSYLHRDPHIKTVEDEIKEIKMKHNKRLQLHNNLEMKIINDKA